MTPRRDLLVAALLCVLGTGTLMVAARDQGFTRDEGYYFDAGEMYWAWYGELGDSLVEKRPKAALARTAIDRWFAYNHEHPVLMKTLFGASWRWLHKCDCPKTGHHAVPYHKPHRTLGLLSHAAAARFPAHLFGGILVALVYLFGAASCSRRAGLTAAVLTLAAPRLFFDAQLACFDAPMATTWFLTIYAYWRSLTDRRWAWRAGVALGLAMATKHNAFFLPFLLVAHYLWVRRDRLKKFRLPPIPLAFVWMLVLAPIVELLHWPWMWSPLLDGKPREVAARFAEYLEFHLHHVYYNFEYLGVNYNKPPFPRSFAYVMTLFTMPATTLALAAGGAVLLFLAWRRARPVATPHPPPRWREPAAGMDTGDGMLLAMNALFPPSIIALTGAPIFGATKHWHPAIPFLALLAGIALDRLTRAVARDGRALAAAGVALAIAPAVLETARSHPYGLTHYNLLAGGPPGGADLGMNRQFWGYATRGILPWLDERAPKNAAIYWHDTGQAILDANVREGLQRPDLRNTGLEEPGVKASTIAMVIHEKHFNKYEYWIWDFYGTSRPARVLTYEGVPVVTVYERPK